MKRILSTLSLLALSAGAALAHPGHVAAREGHDHFPFIIALALAAVLLGGIGAGLLMRRRKRA